MMTSAVLLRVGVARQLVPLSGLERLGGGAWRRKGQVRALVTTGHLSCCHDDKDKQPAPPFKVLFLGTDSFALTTLKALNMNRSSGEEASRVVDTLHVISTSAKSPVAQFARAHDLPLLSWPPDLSDLDLYDLGVLVSFGKLVPRKVITRLPHGILNVHPSLLPRWRGANPITHTVLNADTETAASIISIQPAHFDRGPVVRQEKITVAPGTSALSLANCLAERGARLLMSTLEAMPDVLTRATPQTESGATYAHKVGSSAAWVDWERHGVRHITQQYLALSHTLPLRSSWNEQMVKLLDMVVDIDPSFTPSSPHPPSSLHHSHKGNDTAISAGAVTYDSQLEAICVKCADGWVAFRSVVLRKPMTALDFYNGYLSKGKHPDLTFRSIHNGLFCPEYWDFVHQPKVAKFRAKS